MKADLHCSFARAVATLAGAPPGYGVLHVSKLLKPSGDVCKSTAEALHIAASSAFSSKDCIWSTGAVSQQSQQVSAIRTFSSRVMCVRQRLVQYCSPGFDLFPWDAFLISQAICQGAPGQSKIHYLLGAHVSAFGRGERHDLRKSRCPTQQNFKSQVATKI